MELHPSQDSVFEETDDGASNAGEDGMAVGEAKVLRSRPRNKAPSILVYGDENTELVARRIAMHAGDNWRIITRCLRRMSVPGLLSSNWITSPLEATSPGDVVILDVLQDAVWRDAGAPALDTEGHYAELEVTPALAQWTRDVIDVVSALAGRVSAGVKVFIVAPFPKFITRKCCGNPNHMQNWSTAAALDVLLPALHDFELCLRYATATDNRVHIVGSGSISGSVITSIANALFFVRNMEENEGTYNMTLIDRIIEIILS